jgi:peptidoglycan hydrolase-like protein with peptidoglycan-binding domain
MKTFLKDFRLGATALAVAVMLAGATPNFVAFAQTTSPPTATPVALSEPTIKALQEALNKQGIAVKIDGVLNDETRAGIRKYQSQHHVPVTGEPDKATLDKLGVRQSAAPAQSPVLAQATPTSPAGSPSAPAQTPTSPAPDASTQPGQLPGSTTMNCPMMQGQMQTMMQMMQGMQGMMQMMQGQMQPGQMQPGQMQPSAR